MSGLAFPCAFAAVAPIIKRRPGRSQCGRFSWPKLAFAAFLVAGEAAAQKKSLVVGMGSADAGKLDPHIASTTPDKGRMLQYMFNGLVRI